MVAQHSPKDCAEHRVKTIRNSGFEIRNVKSLFLLLLCCLAGFAARSQAISASAQPAPQPRNLKVLDEHMEGNYLVRTVQYEQGYMRVTQTIYMPKKLKVGTRVAVNPDTMRKDSVRVVVYKKNYNVQVWYRNRMLRSYHAVFGPRPLQDKVMEGDRCTPEGSFTITTKNPASKYTKFLGISYPNDVCRARFNKMKAAGQVPASASIGGNIGIHGIWQGGDDMIEMGVGWTDGCIAMCNRDIEDLYALVGVGTRVIIQKEGLGD